MMFLCFNKHLHQNKSQKNSFIKLPLKCSRTVDDLFGFSGYIQNLKRFFTENNNILIDVFLKKKLIN